MPGSRESPRGPDRTWQPSRQCTPSDASGRPPVAFTATPLPPIKPRNILPWYPLPGTMRPSCTTTSLISWPGPNLTAKLCVALRLGMQKPNVMDVFRHCLSHLPFDSSEGKLRDGQIGSEVLHAVGCAFYSVPQALFLSVGSAS